MFGFSYNKSNRYDYLITITCSLVIAIKKNNSDQSNSKHTQKKKRGIKGGD